jgi:aspartate 1-decarboxylase
MVKFVSIGDLNIILNIMRTSLKKVDAFSPKVIYYNILKLVKSKNKVSTSLEVDHTNIKVL